MPFLLGGPGTALDQDKRWMAKERRPISGAGRQLLLAATASQIAGRISSRGRRLQATACAVHFASASRTHPQRAYQPTRTHMSR